MRINSLLGALLASSSLCGVASAQEEQIAVDSAGDAVSDEIVVIGTNQRRYIIEEEDAATRLDLDFLENPRNVTLIPEQLILDRKITELEEALRNAPGVVAGDGFGGTRNDFFLRGFRRNGEYRNGFRRASIYKANLANIEYTQVIRGPAAITYGQVEPGGVVDVITKTPQDDQRIAGELRYASFDDFFALIDYNQPIGDRAGVRIVGSFQDSESFRDFANIRRNNVAISGEYELSERTVITGAWEWRDESRPLDRGTAVINLPGGEQAIINEVLDVPFSRRFGDPFEVGEVEVNFLEASLAHEFNDAWSIRTAFAYETSKGGDLQSRPQTLFVANADDTRINDAGFLSDAYLSGFAPALQSFAGASLLAELSANPFDDPSDRVFLAKGLDGSPVRDTEAFYANAFLNGDFTTGPFSHRFVLGGDYRHLDQSRKFVRGARTDGIDNPFFNVLDPVYTLPNAFSLDSVIEDEFGPDEDFGVFANIYSEFWRFGVLLGGRYSDVSDKTLFGAANIEREQKSSNFVPQAGLTFRVTDNISLYGSYAESFTPNSVIPDGALDFRAIDPEEGQQFEVGMKAEFLDGRLQTNIALYDIEKVNVFSGVDENDIPIFVDGRTARGIEVSVTGQPLPGMNVTAAYSYNESEITGGARPSGVPEIVLNLYASYEVQHGVLEGVGLGAGYYYESDRFGNIANTFSLGDINLVDLSAWYTIPAPSFFDREDGTLRFQVAVKNVFDDEYYLAASNTLRIPLGTPRAVFGSISFDL